MSKSLSYYLLLLALKLKGVKKNFSKSPIDYMKIREEDVHKPKGFFSKTYVLNKFNILETLVTEIGKNEHATNLLIYIPGGAFISGPAQHHWDSAQKIIRNKKYKVWMCDYPKSPENKILKISENIDAIYTSALEQFQANKISFIGDSVGATLITCLIQRLVIKNLVLPNKIILITPVMDASMSNPEIERINKIDPILSKNGVLSAKKMCIDNNDLKNVMISPLLGSFKAFPNTILFLAENDIMYPDGKLAAQKMKKNNVELRVIIGDGMPHIWPLLPIMKEAKISFNEIIRLL